MLCDYDGYVYMFLSVATSNMVATSLAQQVFCFIILFYYFGLEILPAKCNIVAKYTHLNTDSS